MNSIDLMATASHVFWAWFLMEVWLIWRSMWHGIILFLSCATVLCDVKHVLQCAVPLLCIVNLGGAHFSNHKSWPQTLLDHSTAQIHRECSCVSLNCFLTARSLSPTHQLLPSDVDLDSHVVWKETKQMSNEEWSFPHNVPLERFAKGEAKHCGPQRSHCVSVPLAWVDSWDSVGKWGHANGTDGLPLWWTFSLVFLGGHHSTVATKWSDGSHVGPVHSHWRRMVKPNQTKPNQTKPNQTKPNQTKPNQTKPNQTKPNQTKPNQNLPTTKTSSKNACVSTTLSCKLL